MRSIANETLEIIQLGNNLSRNHNILKFFLDHHHVSMSSTSSIFCTYFAFLAKLVYHLSLDLLQYTLRPLRNSWIAPGDIFPSNLSQSLF